MFGMPSQTIKRLVALHGWFGTVLSIMLYVVMLTGAVIVFDSEIQRWSQGAQQRVQLSDRPVDTQLRSIAASVPAEFRDDVFIGGGYGGNTRFTFTAHVEPEDKIIEVLVDNNGTEVMRREATASEFYATAPGSALMRFIVDLHVRLHVPEPWGLYITGILGFAMLIAAITGVLIHRHIIRDAFVTGRPGNKVVSDRDRHTLSGVWGLPFAVVLAFTGAFLSFALSLGLPMVAMVAFGGDTEKAVVTVMGEPEEHDFSPASLARIDMIIAKASEVQGGQPVGALGIAHYGTRSAEVTTFHSAKDGSLLSETIIWDGVTGEFLNSPPIIGTQPSAGATLVGLMVPLHFGNFAGVISRAVWAGLGAAMTYSIVTGMILWLRRREDDPAWAACRLVLISVVWGLPLAMVAATIGYFLTEPFDYGYSGTLWGFLYGATASIAFVAFFDKIDERRRSDILRLTLGASLLILPFLRMVAVGPWWIGDGILQADPAVASIDLACLSIGIWVGLTPFRRLFPGVNMGFSQLSLRGLNIKRLLK